MTLVETIFRYTKNGNKSDTDLNQYKKLIRLLRYILYRRPDLAYIVWILSIFMARPKSSHLAASNIKVQKEEMQASWLHIFKLVW